MFSKQITSSDAFADMPSSSQLLYFHLNMEADDDGFVSNPKRIIRTINVGDDDLKILVAKRFILPFPSGVIVIKHWLLHNAVRKDMYQPTQYLEEKNTLKIKDNNSYTEVRNETVTKPLHRIDKVRLDKDRIEKDSNTAETSSADIVAVIESFISINPSCKNMYGNKTQRLASLELIETYGVDETINCIKNVLPVTNKLEYFPSITTPSQLRDKWSSLKASMDKHRMKQKSKTIEIIQ